MQVLPQYPERPELALVALPEMLYRSRSQASPAMAASIREHLLVIAADARHPAAVREAARRMANDTTCALLRSRLDATMH
jgi:hypothetical protein